MNTEERSNAQEVAEWLRQHPRFLQQFPDLAEILQVPREKGSAASLASYQLDVLRDKNRELNRRLAELFANAQQNERLAVRTHQLALALMAQRNAADSVRTFVASLTEDFHGDRVRLVLFQPIADLDAAPWLRYCAKDAPELAPFREALAVGEPICGRLNPDKNAFLYGEDAASIHSSVLLPLPDTGLVAVGSHDGNRFFPGMGTLFLRMMGDTLVSALRR